MVPTSNLLTRVSLIVGSMCFFKAELFYFSFFYGFKVCICGILLNKISTLKKINLC